MKATQATDNIRQYQIRCQRMQKSPFIHVRKTSVGRMGEWVMAMYRTRAWMRCPGIPGIWLQHQRTTGARQVSTTDRHLLWNLQQQNMRKRKEMPIFSSQAGLSLTPSRIQTSNTKILLSPNSQCPITAQETVHRDHMVRIFPSSSWCVVGARTHVSESPAPCTLTHQCSVIPHSPAGPRTRALQNKSWT